MRIPSVFGRFPVNEQKRPVFPFADRTDAAAGSDVLLRQTSGKALRARLQDVTLNQFDKLQKADVSAADFETACAMVEVAVQKEGFNPSDVAATMWSSLVGAGGISRPDLRQTACLRKWEGVFKVYGLTLPAVDNPPPSPPPPPANDPVAELDEAGLRSFMSAMFELQGMTGASEARIRAFQQMLADYPRPSVEAEPSFGLSSLDSSANARFVAEKLAGLSSRSGCYFRGKDRSVTYLSRITEPQVEGGQPLWLFNLRLASRKSQVSANSAMIQQMTIRNARADDMSLVAQMLPKRTGCHDLATAPG